MILYPLEYICVLCYIYYTLSGLFSINVTTFCFNERSWIRHYYSSNSRLFSLLTHISIRCKITLFSFTNIVINFARSLFSRTLRRQ